MRIIIGLIMMAAGFLLVWKATTIIDFTGRNDWAESHLGTEGGSYLLCKLIGLAVIFAGILVITGLWQGFFEATVGALFTPGR